MSTVETILSRMMNDADFADAVFANVEKALAEYSLSHDELLKFSDLSRAQFDSMVANPEDRKSLGRALGSSSPILYNALTNNENL